ncbi:MAG: hypothetical protein IEMM0002_0830 [bacterium]|nr:MAG: hypothetical protein IEMM0002_0830 [bacterium]
MGTYTELFTGFRKTMFTTLSVTVTLHTISSMVHKEGAVQRLTSMGRITMTSGVCHPELVEGRHDER